MRRTVVLSAGMTAPFSYEDEGATESAQILPTDAISAFHILARRSGAERDAVPAAFLFAANTIHTEKGADQSRRQHHRRRIDELTRLQEIEWRHCRQRRWRAPLRQHVISGKGRRQHQCDQIGGSTASLLAITASPPTRGGNEDELGSRAR